MANSGTIRTNTEYDSHFWVKWWLNSQDVAGNRSQIGWSCGVYCGHRFYTNAIRMGALTVNGTQVYAGGTYSNYSAGDHTIASGTLSVGHGNDGAKTFEISSFTGWLYDGHNYAASKSSHTLPAIPRKATVTAANDFTDQDDPSISFSNPGGFRIDVWLEPNPNGEHLCVRENIPNIGEYTWNLSDDERRQLRSKCTGAQCKIRLGIYTYIGDQVYAACRDKTFSVTERSDTKPAVTITATPDNSTLPEDFRDLCLQSKSQLRINVRATGQYGATVGSCYAVLEGKSYLDGATTDVIRGSGEVAVTGYAVDSRGFTGQADTAVQVTPYAKPLVVPVGSDTAIGCYRSDADGNRVGSSAALWVKAKRTYYDLGQRNTCVLQWRCKPADAVWSDTEHPWHDLLSGTDASDVYDALLPDVEFNPASAYTVQLQAVDDLGESDIKTFEIPTQDVALHLGKGGKNVTVGDYCDYGEDYTFRSAWNGRFDKDLTVNGTVTAGTVNGLYIRTTTLWGTDTLKLASQYTQWDSGGGNRQSFLVFGSRGNRAVLGVIVLSSAGTATWTGLSDSTAETVTVTKEANGILRLTFAGTGYDWLTFLSPEPFTLQ